MRNKIGKERDRLSKRFKQILGPIVVLFGVLTSHELANLLSTSESQVDVTLNSLYSVLNIPKDKLLAIRLLHPSLATSWSIHRDAKTATSALMKP